MLSEGLTSWFGFISLNFLNCFLFLVSSGFVFHCISSLFPSISPKHLLSGGNTLHTFVPWVYVLRFTEHRPSCYCHSSSCSSFPRQLRFNLLIFIIASTMT